jgi:hypothetical protein
LCRSGGVCGCIPTGGAGCAIDLDCCADTATCSASGVCQP